MYFLLQNITFGLDVSYPVYLNDRELFTTVLLKIKGTDERLCKEPYLLEDEYQKLIQFVP